jgi:uncharacterized repeat protein (TIGR03803 family)
MRATRFPRALEALRIPVVILLLFLTPATCRAQTFRVLHNFGAGNDGAGILSTLAFDKNGNLYGASSSGGSDHACNGFGCGAVFEMTPVSGGGWKESVIHSFSPNTGDSPNGPLAIDAAGDLYGTTSEGGTYLGGTVFKLAPGSDGWTSTVLYEVGDLSSSVILDQAGNLYGPIGAGTYGGGAIAELSPGSDGWTYKILHSFCRYAGCPDGELPSNLIWDSAGNLYGTAFSGGYVYPKCDGCGTVFELLPQPGDGWKDRTLHKFGAFHGDGIAPESGLILDQSGNVYGATVSGGSHACGLGGCGTVFRLTPESNGSWRETILYNFEAGGNGFYPDGQLAMDKAGNLYGTTGWGGASNNCGVIYKLSPGSNGRWRYTRLHVFLGPDGCDPAGGLIIDGKGNLYGAALGGKYGLGVVFEITP